MKYVCNKCGTVFDAIPRVYRGFSGDHFGGSETILPGCTHCGKYDFSQYTDDGYREILTLREQIKVLRAALDDIGKQLTTYEFEAKHGCKIDAAGDLGDGWDSVINVARKALEQTKPKDGE